MAANPFETSNPFAVTAPGVPSTSTVTAPGQAATQAASAEGYQATTATTERMSPTLRTVQDNELVQKQLEQIIGNDSPLIQRARQKALEGMNARGLVNSSMAMGAADAAMYDTALPIARDDAATFSGAARDNQAVTNDSSKFNAGEFNQTSRTNAGLISRASEFGAGEQNRANLSNADAVNRAALQSNDQVFRASVSNADATNRATLQANDQTFRASLANAEPQTQAALSVLDSELAQTRQNSATASEVYRQYQSSATAILTSDLPEESKQAAINTLLNSTRQAMRFTQAMDLADIDAILTMPDITRVNATAGGAAGASSDPVKPSRTSGDPAPQAPAYYDYGNQSF